MLLADDHVPLRRGVRLALEQGGFRVVGDVGDAESAVDAAVRLRPDICLLDINMPGDGIRAAAAIREKVPSTVIVMLTVSQEDDDLFAALKAGAEGYLLKATDPTRLAAELSGVLVGEAALSRRLVARLIDEFRKRDARDARLKELEQEANARLTVREWQILEELGRGRTTTEIAERLGIAQVTVRTHVASVLRKLQAPDRETIVQRLRRMGDEPSRD